MRSGTGSSTSRSGTYSRATIFCHLRIGSWRIISTALWNASGPSMTESDRLCRLVCRCPLRKMGQPRAALIHEFTVALLVIFVHAPSCNRRHSLGTLPRMPTREETAEIKVTDRKARLRHEQPHSVLDMDQFLLHRCLTM
jgi:hypothetical protein